MIAASLKPGLSRPGPVHCYYYLTHRGLTPNHRLCGRSVNARAPSGRYCDGRINRRWLRDASVGGNWARFINHACTPNCYVEIAGDTIWIRAARNIERGEELSIDYNTGGEVGIACRCRPRCKTFL